MAARPRPPPHLPAIIPQRGGGRICANATYTGLGFPPRDGMVQLERGVCIREDRYGEHAGVPHGLLDTLTSRFAETRAAVPREGQFASLTGAIMSPQVREGHGPAYDLS